MNDYRLPKNIRQIGENEDGLKIYLEDYVNSFIHRQTQKSKSITGILLGQKERMNGMDYLFIKGAIETEELGTESVELTEKIRTYFPNLVICGCFIIDRLEEISRLQLIKMFEESVQGDGQILYYIHGQDEEFCVKSYEDGIRKVAGYYVYYERNEAMQNYMEAEQNKTIEIIAEEPNFSQQPRADTLDDRKKRKKVKKRSKREQSYWKKERGKESGMTDLIVRTVSLVGIFLLAFVIFSDQISITNLGKSTTSTTESIESIEVDATVTEKEEESIVQSSSESLEETLAESVGDHLVIPVAYTVSKGDSIASISLKFYGTLDMVDKICEMNEIVNPDYVQAGQKITLPKRE